VLSEVVVRVNRDDHSQRQEASATRIIYGREELEQSNDMAVGDFLRKLPGVVVSGAPGKGREARMRGMKGYTQILIDGEKSGGGKDRSVDVDQLPLELIERIEVIRTPTADMPNEGIAGTINIVMREAPDTSQRSMRLATGWSQSEGADATPLQLTGLWSERTEDVRWLLNASYTERAEPSTTHKDVREFDATGATTARSREVSQEPLKNREFNLAPRWDWRNGGDRFNLSLMLQLQDNTRSLQRQLWNGNGLDFATLNPNGQAFESEQKNQTALQFRGGWRRRLNNSGEINLSLSARVGEQQSRTLGRELDAAGSLSQTTNDALNALEQSYRWGLKGTHPVADVHVVTWGLENDEKRRMDDRIRLQNGVPVVTDIGDSVTVQEQQWTGYLQDEMELSGTQTVVGGLRLSRLQRTSEAANGVRESHSVSISPSLHHRWALAPNHLLRSSINRSMKLPRFDDLSPQLRLATGVGPGSFNNPDKGGNPDLRPEQATALEVGWEHLLHERAGTLGANLFWRDIQDLVEKRKTLEGGRYVERPYNSGTAQVWGLELDARMRLAAWGFPELTLRGNYTRLFSRVHDSTSHEVRRMKEQPDYIVNMGLEWRLPVRELTLGGNYNHLPEIVRDPLTGETESAQNQLDVYVHQQLNRQLGLRLTLSNVLQPERVIRKPTLDATGVPNGDSREVFRRARQIYVALEGKW
jgi:iron complex outermembrane receptor protein